MKIISRSLSLAAALTVGAVGLTGAALPGTALADASGKASPAVAAPGEDVAFFVQCETNTAESATLFGATLGLPARIPMTAAQAEGSFNTNVTVPDGTQSGDYDLSMDCSDGSSTTAGLTVVSGSGPHTGGGGLALVHRQRAEEPTNTGRTVGWALVGGVLVGGLVIAVVIRRRRDRA
jgi:hypothetical protein